MKEEGIFGKYIINSTYSVITFLWMILTAWLCRIVIEVGLKRSARSTRRHNGLGEATEVKMNLKKEREGEVWSAYTIHFGNSLYFDFAKKKAKPFGTCVDLVVGFWTPSVFRRFSDLCTWWERRAEDKCTGFGVEGNLETCAPGKT